MEFYAEVRRCVYERAAARRTGPRDGALLRYRLPPGYRRTQLRCPKLDGHGDHRSDPARRSASPEEATAHGHAHLRTVTGARVQGRSYTIVKDDVREKRLGGQEMFVPLVHPPGDAQADFGEALVVVDGVERKAHYLVVDLPHSDDAFVKAFPAETTEAFCEGHNAAFHYVAACRGASSTTTRSERWHLGDGTRQRTQVFSELQSHYLFDDRFGRPGKDNDKGKVEGLVGSARRNWFVPIPHVASWDALNADLARQCRDRRGQRLRRHTETIGERFARDRAALLPLPPVPYEACDTRRGSRLSLVRYRRNDYSVPTAYGHREVVVKGFVDEVVIVCGSEEIARHRRSYEREALIFEPRHYLALLERKIGALDQAAPLAGWTLPEAFGRLRRLLEARLGQAGTREYVQVLRLLEDFRLAHVSGAIQDALRLGAIGFDAVKHLVLCRLDRPGAVSASAGPARDDDRRGRLHRVMAHSTLLLDAHLKALRLPT